MILNAAKLRTLFVGFNAAFTAGMTAAPIMWPRIAMRVQSAARSNEYGWLGATPGLREWIGDRFAHNLSVSSYTLVNRTFEMKVTVRREEFEDDQYGVYAPLMEKMGRDAAMFPDRLVFELLKTGFTNPCFDGRPFFDASHPVGGVGGGPVAAVSNLAGGSGTPWFLLDCSQPIKPLIFQERRPFAMVSSMEPTDPKVLDTNEFEYFVDGRCNAGYGFWQLAYASLEPLNADNYAAARAAMMSFLSDSGEPLNIRPTHLVAPPSLEKMAMGILNAEYDVHSASNVWRGTAEPIITPYVI